ncbi:MAG: PA14 domain-containing protein [Victivallaceae bacterium]
MKTPNIIQCLNLKTLCGIFLMFSMLCPCIASAGLSDWHVPDAEFRLEFKTDSPGLTGYVDLSQYMLPEKLDNGIDVRDDKGRKIAYYMYKNLGLFFAPAAQSAVRYVYFGFKKPAEAPPWPKELGRAPENYQLRIRIFNARLNYITEKEWLDRQKQNITERYKKRADWHMRYFISQSWERYYTQYFYPWRVTDVRFYMNTAYIDKDWNKTYDPEDFLAWKRPSSYRRSMGWVEYQYRNKAWEFWKYNDIRMEWAVKRLKRFWNNREKELKRAEINSKGIPEREMMNVCERKWFSDERNNWKQTLLEKGMFEARNHFAAVINGMLLVPADGEYEFAVNTSSSTLLLINDKIVIDWYGEHERPSGWEKPVKLKLKRGLSSFKFYYHKNFAITYAACAWKKPGDSDFTILEENNFSPGWPNLPSGCKNKDGRSCPLVKKVYSCILYTGKREKCLWEKYIALDCGTGDCEWTINGRKAAFGKDFDLVSKEGTDDKVMLMPEDKNFAPMNIVRFDNDREKPYSRPDIALKLWLPDFIFDDETLDLFVEVNSKLPHDAICYLDTAATPENCLFTNGSEKINLPGKPFSEQNRFIQDSVFKKQIMLKGEYLRNKTDVEFKLKLPGMTFDSAKARFINVRDLPPMVSGTDALYDSDCNIVVPVIHRPELSEIRKWELPAAVINRLAGNSKALVVADDFSCGKETFSSALQQMLNEDGVELEFVPWQCSGANHLLENFAAVLPFVLKSDADIAIIIPPAHELYSGAPVRNQYRMLAALTSAFKGKNIMLSTSFPPVFPDSQADELNAEIKRLAREYGAAVLDLNYFIKENKEWKKSYRTSPEQDDTLELLPVQNIRGVCRIITSELR